MATTPNRSWPTPDDTDLVRDGASAIRALGDAIDGTVGQGFVYAGTRYYESSGQFEKADPLGTGDIGLRAIRVRMVGGGAGGGGARAQAGEQMISQGGSGGGFSESFITDIDGLSSSVAVTAGAGSSGATGLSSAGNGGQSSFGSLVVANGGIGGLFRSSTTALISYNGTEGGAPGTGDIALPGGRSAGFYALTNRQGNSGDGGDSVFGVGGVGRAGGARDGNPGLGFGSGGSGAKDRDDADATGGNGARGIVIIDCFV